MKGEARPPASSEGVRQRMRRQRARNTEPELALRRELHRRGLRFRVHRRCLDGLRRTVDIVFGPTKVAVDVRGCFWHGCPEHAVPPKANAAWWQEKLQANRRRDDETEAAMTESGWAYVVVWEHEDPTEAADRVERLVYERRSRP